MIFRLLYQLGFWICLALVLAVAVSIALPTLTAIGLLADDAMMALTITHALPTQPVLMARGRHGICGAALTLLIPSTVSPTQMATGQLADAAIMEAI